ncbi:hypothetical protein D3C75_1297800 [compost metagenome]
MGHHQQAIGEPDSDEQKADPAQQCQGATNRNRGETRTPVQQRGFAHTAPFNRQVQGGRSGQSD